MDITGESRLAYRPSGRVDWSKFLPGFLGAAAAAVAMAWVLCWVFYRGFYLILVAPLVAAFVVGGVWRVVLIGSHCRNKGVATFGSVALAILVYFGYYQISLIQLVGVRNAHRVDLLPRYVQFRMETDVSRKAHGRNAGNGAFRKPDAVQQGLNWTFLGIEFALVAGVLIGIGRSAASKAYCEPCRRWMKRETLKLPPGLGASVWDLLRRNEFAEARGTLADTSRRESITATLAIEHCPACPGVGRSSEMFLTVQDLLPPGMPDPIAAKAAAAFKPRTSAPLRTIADHVALRPEEVGVLARVFPGLQGTLEAHPEFFAEARSAAREPGPEADAPTVPKTGPVARIEAVGPPDSGTVLTPKNAILQTLIGVLSAFGFFGLAFAPAVLVGVRGDRLPDWMAGVALAWLFGGLALNLVWAMFFASYPTSRFMLGRTRHAFEFRANPAVDLNDPDLFFVDIVPRINWGKVMAENASDIGFLDINPRRRELIFEGDRQRYWIPAGSILEVKHEFWAAATKHQLQSTPTLSHVVVVRAMTADGPWETWFYRRHNKFRRQTAERRLADSLELEATIRDLIGPST